MTPTVPLGLTFIERTGELPMDDKGSHVRRAHGFVADTGLHAGAVGMRAERARNTSRAPIRELTNGPEPRGYRLEH